MAGNLSQRNHFNLGLEKVMVKVEKDIDDPVMVTFKVFKELAENPRRDIREKDYIFIDRFVLVVFLKNVEKEKITRGIKKNFVVVLIVQEKRVRVLVRILPQVVVENFKVVVEMLEVNYFKVNLVNHNPL